MSNRRYSLFYLAFFLVKTTILFKQLFGEPTTSWPAGLLAVRHMDNRLSKQSIEILVYYQFELLLLLYCIVLYFISFLVYLTNLGLFVWTFQCCINIFLYLLSFLFVRYQGEKVLMCKTINSKSTVLTAIEDDDCKGATESKKLNTNTY